MKNNPRVINAWAMYDWANSVFALTIKTAIFPIYYDVITRLAAIEFTDKGASIVDIFGFKVVESAAYSFTLTFGFLTVAIISPLLSGIADYGGIKKKMMQFFVIFGSLGCIGLYFTNENSISLALILLAIGSIGFNSSLVFYNAFLPIIATKDKIDQVSAKGFSFGYIGSVLLLIINLLIVMMPHLFFDVAGKTQELISLGLTESKALNDAENHYKIIGMRICFITVGLWWIGFSQITFKHLPKETQVGKITKSIVFKGFNELKKVIKQLNKMPKLKWYILAFWVANTGVQTTMYMASLFGKKEVFKDDPNSTAKLIITVLIIQLIAIPGAYLFTYLSKRIGNISTLASTSIFWVIACISAYFVQSQNTFYAIAVLVGLLMGGTQSLTRSTFAKLIPKDTIDHASFFSFYDVMDKLSVVAGTFVFGIASQLTGSMRVSALSLASFFILGGIMLYFVNKIKD